MTQTDDHDAIRRIALEQSLPLYFMLWHQLLDAERRKSPMLPILSGHKAYSQNDEDGIIQEILKRIGIAHETFFEIGTGNGTENNTLFWLKQGWKGAWIEGSAGNAEFIRQAFRKPIEQGDLEFAQAMVSAENINSLVAATRLSGREIDILSIDIDGNDYYVFERLELLNARVVIIEYNARFPPPARWRIPYEPGFSWDGSDRYGASLQSMSDLFDRRNYALVACNATGANAFFVRKDLVGDLFPFAGETEKLYQPPRPVLTAGLFGHIAGTGSISVRLDCRYD